MLPLEERQKVVLELLGSLVEQAEIANGELRVYVPPQSIREVLAKLRDDPRLLLDVLSYIAAVDYFPREPRFEVVYDLYSLVQHHRVRVKCKLADTGNEDVLPEIPSVHDIYLTANWHEREAYDLMGIRFTGHPDLRRILLADRWDGHPLRKEYPYDGKRAWKLGCSVAEAGSATANLGL
jgi:NADH-quinone oxidoreductase subunit C